MRQLGERYRFHCGAKKEQYERWRELGKMQQENEAKAKAIARTQTLATLEAR